MGFNSTAIRFFLASVPRIGDISSTIVLGRQSFTPTLPLLKALQKEDLISKSGENTYCDEFFSKAGVKHLDYLDISAYQGANILQDLGKEIPSSLKGRYDLVIDAGTLEHIPDFLFALQNTMSLVKNRGFLMILSPGNNFMGHGCYQLSPEIFHRVLSEENGFKVRISFIHEPRTFRGKWNNVPDSKSVNSRVEVTTKGETYVCILAERISDKPSSVGHQSDYENAWNQEPNISKAGNLYLNAPYYLQRIVYLLVLKRKYRRRANNILKRVGTSGALNLPDFETFWNL